jgi:phosphatidylserine decarboxylase
MNAPEPIRYFDRESQEVVVEKVFAEGFLDWAYNSLTGRIFGEIAFSNPLLSCVYGRLNRTSWSRRKVPRFVEQMNVDVGELLQPVCEFASFDAFFSREIDLALRPISSDPAVCIAPVDGRCLAYPWIRVGRRFTIKRHSFDLTGLLQDDALAALFDRGSMVVCRLSLADYHHFHFPDDGVVASARTIPGKYHASGPYARRRLIPFYAENYRVLTLFESDSFNTMALIEVGAFTVGSIRQVFAAGQRVRRGAPKGFFEIGGSTVVMLFREGVIEFDRDLLEHTEAGLETRIRLGDSIGRRS